MLCYREGLYNLTCVINNGVDIKNHTMLLPILNFTCDVTLLIQPKEDTNAIKRSIWYSSETVTLLGIINRDQCLQVSKQMLNN